MQKFVHLHTHSHYSILEAICTPKEFIKKAKDDGQTTLALTDSAVMFGSLEFYKACRKEKIKPIIGMRANIANGSRFARGKELTNKKKHFHLVLLAKNNTGYKNLMKLSSLGSMEGFYYVPRIDRELLEKHKEGLIALSGGFGGELGYYLNNTDVITAKENASYYKNLFGDDYYVELQNHKIDFSEDLLKAHVDLAKELNIPIVATNNVHYLEKEHAEAHNVHLLIRDTSAANAGTADVKNLRFRSDQFYFKSQDEMLELFEDYPEAIENTLKIAEQCNIELDLATNHMPSFPIPETSKANDLDEYLKELVYEGLEMRFGEIEEDVKKRADYELNIIKTMGFPGYFLIVWDFIKASREIGVSVGPGRGSAAGSLVAFALEITNVDPLKYDLLFERFLNPERVSMPDIDIDFNDEKRDMSIDYTKHKYGENAVSQIITFSKLTTKAVLTDVGRVMGVKLSTLKEITKLIPSTFGKVLELKKAIKLPEIKQIIENSLEKNLADCIKYAIVLEDKIRGTGIHAAGVVIAPGELTDYVPVYKPTRSRDQSLEIATQYSMQDLEDAGLLKMDFLGLRTLSIIDNTLEMIKDNYNEDIDIDKIDINDEKTFKMISDGDTQAIFQFESDGMQEYLKKLKPKSLEELTAMNALYRPGPMENIPEFIDRKFGRKEIKYLHPLMEKSLKNTYGIIVYQEQVMMLVQDIAGFTLGQADVLRRAMGKKVLSIMNDMKPLFAEGAAKHGINNKLAFEIFELIEKFANYGFNKSHSLAYSYIAFQTAWLKSHYPAEFLAANMTAVLGEQSKIVKLRDNAKKFGIELMPPDVNKSNTKFIAKENKIYFSLAAIKNVGIPAVESVVEARKEKNFTSFFDFISRVDTRLINKRALEALIFSGAFDSLGVSNRKSLFLSIDRAFDYAKSFEESKNLKMDSLFLEDDGNSIISTDPKLVDTKDWDENKKLEKEKEFLNFYVSGHPMLKYLPHLHLASIDMLNSKQKDLSKSESICGMISSIRRMTDKKDNPIAFVNLEDFNGNKVECIFWANSFANCKNRLVEDTFVMIVGSPRFESKDKDSNNSSPDSMKNSDMKIISKHVYSANDMVVKYVNGYKIWLELNEDDVMDKLISLNLDICNNKDYLVFEDEGDEEDTHITINQKDVKNAEIIFNLYDRRDKDFHSTYFAKNLKLPVNQKVTEALIELFGIDSVRFIKNPDVK